jgi:hypothetical protein
MRKRGTPTISPNLPQSFHDVKKSQPPLVENIQPLFTMSKEPAAPVTPHVFN